MLDAGVGISIEKDSLQAGKKVVKEALSGINTKPKIAILAVDSMARRAYDYKKILEGVRQELDKDVTLIGSTVNGILVNDRFALRSVGLMLIGGDISIDNPYNYSKSRLEYESIAEKIYQKNSNLDSNNNRFMLIFQDGLKFSQKVLDKQKSLNSRFAVLFSSLIKKAFAKQIEQFKEQGVGIPSVQELLEVLYKKGWKYPVFGNVASNLRNYDSMEFFNDEIGEDNIVGATITAEGNTKFGFGFGAGAEPTGSECKITKNIGSFLLKIDEKPAVVGLCDAAGINKETLEELRGSGYVNYYIIIGTTEKVGDKEMIHLTATVSDPNMENFINTGFPFERVPEKIQIFRSNMKILHKTTETAVSQALSNINNPKFLLGFDCVIKFFAYGDNLPRIIQTIDNIIDKDLPRMIVGSGGEIFGSKDLDYYFNNMSFVTLAGGE